MIRYALHLHSLHAPSLSLLHRRAMRLPAKHNRLPLYTLLLAIAIGFTLMPTVIHAAGQRQEISSAAAEIIAAETPKTVVAEGVNSFTLVEPKIFWHTDAICPPQPPAAAAGIDATTAADDPVVVSRIASYGSTIRQLFYSNEPRPADVCNPYFIRSNVVADQNYVYWADDTGLIRLSVNANVGDPVDLMTEAVKSVGNGQKVELAVDDNNVYAMIYPAANQTKVLRVNKAPGLGGQHQVGTLRTAAGLGRRLSHDGEYAYWLEGSTLFRGRTAGAINPVPAPIASGVTGYYAEGPREFCILGGCSIRRLVYIGQDDQVVFYVNGPDSTSNPIYTSAGNVSAFIYDMTSDDSNLFILESRPNAPDPEGFIFHNQTLVRTGRFGDVDNSGVLYQNLSDFPGIDTDHLTTDGEELFWMELDGGENTIKRLPNDAEVIEPVNIEILDVHVTQGIQNNNNDVQLIQGRRTFVKVRARTDTFGDVAEGVTAFLYGTDADGNTLGLPLAPINADGTHRNILWVSYDFMDEGEFLFEIPMNWLDGTPIKFRVAVNPYDSPIETTLADNEITTKVFTPRPSPRFHLEFYILNYTVNGMNFEPRPLEDVTQTFDWMRRAYPLASAPGMFNDPTPGLRPRLRYVGLSGLGAHVDQSHSDCDDLGDNKNSCAAIFVNATLRHWRDLAKSNHIYFGLMSDGGGFPRGKGGNGVASGPAGDSCCGSSFWDFDGAYTDWYSAHEIGHALGRAHPGKGTYCGHSSSDPGYPYAGAQIGPDGEMWGFDGGNSFFGLPRTLLPSHWADVMSYCDLQWISDYTYNALYSAIGNFIPIQASSLPGSGSFLAAQLDTPAQDNYLAVYGVVLPVSTGGQINLLSLHDTDLDAPPPLPGPYAIRLVNGAGQTLANYPFTPDELSGEDDEEVLTFGEIVEYVAGTARVQLVEIASDVEHAQLFANRATVLDEQPVSASTPIVSDVHLVGASEPISGSVTLEWNAHDADGDTLSVDIYYSSDGGISFNPVQAGVIGTSTEIDTGKLGGSDEAVLRVLASDGIRQGSADSASFIMADKPPQPYILNPADGTTIWWGQLVNFIGEAYDFQDGGIVPENLEWRTQDGVLGIGPVLAVADLPVGENEIMLKATNSKGLSAQMSITVIVNDDLVLPGPTLVTAPSIVSWHLPDASAQPVSATIGVQNIGIGDLTWSASDGAPWLSLQASSKEAPATLTVTADPSGIEPGTAISATVMITGVTASGTSSNAFARKTQSSNAFARTIQITQTATILVSLAVGDIWHAYEPQVDNPGDPGGSDMNVLLPVIRKE